MPKKKLHTPESHWRLVERVVAALEQALVPGARIEHNGRLWDSSAKVWRQCDVIIRQDSMSQEIITIVEVQDRPNKKVGLTTFEGWCKKREKLRVHHLICVSVKGFTKGVIEDARSQGNTVVRLLELKELEQQFWPLNFRDGKLTFFWGNPKFDSWTVITQDNKRPDQRFKRGDVEFIRNGEFIQLNHLFAEFFPMIKCRPVVGNFDIKFHIDFGTDDELIMTWKDDQARVLKLTALYKIEMRQVSLAMIVSQYKQIDYEGALAWSALGKGQIDSKDVALNLIFRPTSDGLLRLVEARASGMFEDLPEKFLLTLDFSPP